jgi:hypothetical protein
MQEEGGQDYAPRQDRGETRYLVFLRLPVVQQTVSTGLQIPKNCFEQLLEAVNEKCDAHMAE